MRGTPVVATLAIAAAASILSFRPIYEPDLWWHLAQGRENAAGRLVRTNVFSFAYPDYRQHYTSWLFDTTTYLSWVAGGGASIQLLQAALLALTLALLYKACRARGPAWSAAAVLLVGVFVVEPRAIPRPHLVSFAGLAGCTLLLERVVATRRLAWMWWGVPVIALWSNFHVECVFGVLLLAIFAASELIRPAVLTRADARRALIAVFVCGAATLANPYGWGLLRHVVENSTVPQILSIAELQPPPLATYQAFYVYVGSCVVLLALRWRTLALWEIVATLVFAALGLRFIRLTPLVLLVTAPMVASRVAQLPHGRIGRAPLVALALIVGVAVSRIPPHLLITELSIGTEAIAPARFFSSEAIAVAKRNGLEGPVFNSNNLGGYLAWMLYPRAQIFQDSRLQAYPPEHFLSILVASRSQADWDVLVADVDWAVLSLPRPNQLSGVGRFPTRDWLVVYRDDACEIVVRRRGVSTSSSQLPTPKR